MRSDLQSALIALAVAGLLSAAVLAVAAAAGFQPDEIARGLLIGGVAMLLLVIIWRKRLRRFERDLALKVAARLTPGERSAAETYRALQRAIAAAPAAGEEAAAGWAALAEGLGAAAAYDNLDQAKEEIRRRCREARDIRIFIQLGRKLFGGKYALLSPVLAERHDRGLESCRLLFAGLGPPYLSAERARQRNSSYEEWRDEIVANLRRFERLREERIAIEARVHREPFLWLLVFLDDQLFVQPSLLYRGNSKAAPVFRVARTRPPKGPPANDLYALFERYFEHVWRQASEPASEATIGVTEAAGEVSEVAT